MLAQLRIFNLPAVSCLWSPVWGFSCEIGLFPLLAGIRVARDKVGRWDTIGSVKQCQVAAAC